MLGPLSYGLRFLNQYRNHTYLKLADFGPLWLGKASTGDIRGPKDHVKIRTLHFGSKGQDKEGILETMVLGICIYYIPCTLYTIYYMLCSYLLYTRYRLWVCAPRHDEPTTMSFHRLRPRTRLLQEGRDRPETKQSELLRLWNPKGPKYSSDLACSATVCEGLLFMVWGT